MVFGRTIGLIGIAASLSWCGVAAAQESLPGPNPSSQAESAPAEQASTLGYRNGLLSVSLRGAALTDVLELISTQARIAIVQVGDLSAQRISAAFENVPLVEGLQRLLADYDTFLFFGVDQKPPASVRAVWVYPRGRGRGFAPVPPEAWASTAELHEFAATLADPKERAEAFRALIARGGPRAREAVLQALLDPDALVRSFALNAATSSRIEVAPALLTQALNDPSRDVRFLALEALARGGEAEARAAAEFIRNDPDPLLRRHAEQILDRLAASSKPQPVRPSQVPKGP